MVREFAGRDVAPVIKEYDRAQKVNPDFPDEGRCLVRGICQWGTAERTA